MAIAAPTKAIQGETKIRPAKNANRNPPTLPSSVFARLNGSGLFDIVAPIIDAELSPNENIAIAALLAGAGKISNVSKIPNAKYSGANAIS